MPAAFLPGDDSFPSLPFPLAYTSTCLFPRRNSPRSNISINFLDAMLMALPSETGHSPSCSAHRPRFLVVPHTLFESLSAKPDGSDLSQSSYVRHATEHSRRPSHCLIHFIKPGLINVFPVNIKVQGLGIAKSPIL